MSDLPENATELDVRVIPHQQRHMLIFQAMDKLAVGESLVIKNDHDPVPLRFQAESLYGNQFEWEYLEQGPEVFRLCFTRKEAAPGGTFQPGDAGQIGGTIHIQTDNK